MKTLYELHGEGISIRRIAETLEISRNTVRRYLRSPGVPQPKPRPNRPSKLDPFKEYLAGRLALGIDNFRRWGSRKGRAGDGSMNRWDRQDMEEDLWFCPNSP